jgi:hypothetical protein
MGALHAFDLVPFIEEFKLNTYFETGTGEAVSLKYALKFPFEKLYSVDIDKELIDNLSGLQAENPRLTLINNYSSKALEEFVPTLDKDKPVLFFLDAHFPGADFHKITYEESIRKYQKDAFPLEDEINIIKNLRDTSNDMFIIDDFILYEKNHDYETIKHGVIWRYEWLQKELSLETDSNFIYKKFEDTHNFKVDIKHQGYLIITPKK